MIGVQLRHAKREPTGVRIDLHVHSGASFDCEVPPEQMARRAASLGLAPIFLTDHNTIDGALSLRREGVSGVVIGQEISTRDGELIGLFLNAPIDIGTAAPHAAHEIKAQGGLVYLPHPLDFSRAGLTAEAIDAIIDHVDIVEVVNGRATAEANRDAVDLCRHLGAVPGAGSDAHSLEELGRVWLELEAFDGPQDFLGKLERARIRTKPHRVSLRKAVNVRSLIEGMTPARRNHDAHPPTWS